MRFTPSRFAGAVGEMLVVETVARIRREFFVKGGAAQGSGDAKHRWNGCGGKSIKEIVRDLGGAAQGSGDA